MVLRSPRSARTDTLFPYTPLFRAGAHQLLEPLSLGAAEQRVGGRAHRIELERIFAHPAIAEHLDLAAAHSVGGEGIGVGSARLGDEQHPKTWITLRTGEGAHKHGYPGGTCPTGQPPLCAYHPPTLLL